MIAAASVPTICIFYRACGFTPTAVTQQTDLWHQPALASDCWRWQPHAELTISATLWSLGNRAHSGRDDRYRMYCRRCHHRCSADAASADPRLLLKRRTRAPDQLLTFRNWRSSRLPMWTCTAMVAQTKRSSAQQRAVGVVRYSEGPSCGEKSQLCQAILASGGSLTLATGGTCGTIDE